MRVALQDNIQKEKYGTSVSYNLPPPTGGLNSRDSLTTMQEDEATTLDNWMVRSGECLLRGGYSPYATTPNIVKTLFSYTTSAGVQKLFAVTDSFVYDITSPPAVQMIAVQNGYVHGLLITNSAGTTYWWMASGADFVKTYEPVGSWQTPVITGVNTATLVFPWLFKRRIWAIQKDSMNVWFLPPDAIQGAMESYPFGAVFKKGGSLVAGTSWTLDSGSGPDDLFVLITSEGEVAVYSGTDPKSSSAWALVGVFEVGRPLGRRCFTRFAGDVLVLIESGLYPLSKLLSSGNVNYASALTNKIQTSFTSDVSQYGANEGWETILYPRFDAALVNVPGVPKGKQYVLNTVTGAWSTFSGWGSRCLFNFNNLLYWSRDGLAVDSGAIFKAWDGNIVSDNGADIIGTAKMAYNYFTRRAALKHIELLRPLLAYDGAVEIRLGISSDFSKATFGSILSRVPGSPGSFWTDEPTPPPGWAYGYSTDWNDAWWGSIIARTKLWQNARHAPGYAISVWLQTASKDSTLSWSGTDLVLASGGLL